MLETIIIVIKGSSIMDPEYRGIIPRTVASIFEGVAAADQNVEFTIKVNYTHAQTLEAYKINIRRTRFYMGVQYM